MNGNVYDDTYRNLFEDPIDTLSTSTHKASSHPTPTGSSKIDHTNQQIQKIQATTMAEPIKPIPTNANFMTTNSLSTVIPATPSLQIMNPVFISPSITSTPAATASPPAINTPDDSSDDTASIITGVAFAALIILIALLLIIKRRRQRHHDLENEAGGCLDDDTYSVNSKTRLRQNHTSYVPYKQPASEVSSIISCESPRSSVFNTQGGAKQIQKSDPIPNTARISFSRMHQDIARFSLKKTDSWGNYVKQVLHKPTMNEATNSTSQASMSASAYGVCEVNIDPPETGRCRTESTVSPTMQRAELNREWINTPAQAHAYTISNDFPQQQIIESYHPLAAANSYNSVSPAPRYLPPGEQQQAVRVNLADPAAHQVAFKSDTRPYY